MIQNREPWEVKSEREAAMDLDSIKQRCQQATPAPWEIGTHSSGWYEVRTSVTMPVPETLGFLEMPGVVGNFQQETDAQFVVTARRDTPGLVSELELSNTRLEAIWQWAISDGAPPVSGQEPERRDNFGECKALVRSLFDPNEARSFLGALDPPES